MKILAVETSAVAASAALCEDRLLLGEFFVNTSRVHSQTLMPMVEALLHSCGVVPGDIGLYAVAAGPGSFTGVRIGVAAVKGMAMVNDTPCIGVSSLEALARNVADCDALVCAAMDARRSQVYNALFQAQGGSLTRLTPDRAISLEDLQTELTNYKKNCIIVGDGAELCYNSMRRQGPVRMAVESLRFQRASSVAQLAFERYQSASPSEKADSFTAQKLLPVYLRPSQAERVRDMTRQQGTGQQSKDENVPGVQAKQPFTH